MNNSRFFTLIESAKPVLADFYADWCIPCKQMDPVLKEIKTEFGENIRIVKVNVDINPFISDTYKIHNIPTFILFRKGEIVWKGMGFIPTEQLKEILAGHLNQHELAGVSYK
jgi:thioredoxin 1